MRIENGNLNVNGTTRINQLFDYVNSSGLTGQVLTSVPSGVQWNNIDSVITGSTTGKLNISDFSIFTASTLPSTYFRQSGNTFGTTAILGTNDSQGLSLITSGQSRLFVTNVGNVGIGISSPTSRLDIWDNGNQLTLNTTTHNSGTSILRFGLSTDPGNISKKIGIIANASGSWGRGSLNFALNSTNNNDNVSISDSKLTILDSGNVGVGISTPTSPLFVYTNTSSTTIGDNNSFIIHNNNSGLTVNNITEMFFSDAGQGTGTANGLNLLHRYAGISAFITGWNNSASAGGMDFVTRATTGGALTSKLRINPNGDVGIGLTNPSFKLEVAGNIRVQDGGFLAGTISESEKITFSSISGLVYNVGSSERMRITTTGSVGIGTTSPTARLQVRGAGATLSTTGLRVENSNSNPSLVVRDDGNIGIGISDPSAQLHISGSSSSLLQVASPSNSNLLIISGSNNIGIAMPPVSTSTLSVRAVSAAGGNFSQRWFEPDGVTEVARVRNSNSVGFEVNRLGTIGTSNLTIVGNPAVVINHSNGNSGSITLGDATSTDFTVPLGSGNRTNVAISRPFNLISGSTDNNLRGLLINNVVNSTGSTNTTYRALHITPTVHPSVSLYNSIETGSGNVIFNGGNVGIDIPTPTARLHITGVSNSALFEIDSPTLNNILFVSGSGRVGIGTGTPTQALDVSGNVRASGLVSEWLITPNNNYSSIGGSSQSASGALIVNPQSDWNSSYAGSTIPVGTTLGAFGGGQYVNIGSFNNAGGGVRYFSSLNGSVHSHTWYHNKTTQLMSLSYRGNLEIGGSAIDLNMGRLFVRGVGATSSTTGLRVENSNSLSSFVVKDDRTIGVGIDNPSAQFHISGNTSSFNPLLINTSGGTVALSVNNNSNVGVGTSTPIAKLQVRGAGDSSIWITSEDFNADTNTGTVVRLGTTNSTGNSAGSIDVLNSGISSYGNLSLVRLGGNVGIGTSSPSVKLQVVGDSGNIIRFEDTGGRAGVLGATGTGTNRMYIGYGAEHLSIFSSGNVGIGITSATARLQVRGAGATSSTTGLRVENSNSLSSFVVRDDSTIGVGIDNPTAQFHISGNTSSNPLLINTSGGTVALSVNNLGNVGIGTATPAFTLDVNGTARATTLLETSSQRYKTNIIPLPSQLDTINKLNPVTFNWKDETKGNGTQYGLIAEEVQEIIPDAVETNDDGTAEAISYTKLVPILIKAVQELQKEVNELKEKLNK